MRATRARSAEGTRLPSPGQEVFPWWGLVSPAPSPAGGLQGQLFHLHVGPDKPQREPASAFPGGSAGPSAQGRRVRCSKALCSGACLWPAAPSRAPVARALGFLVTCAGHSWGPPPEEYQHPPIPPPSPCQRCAAQGGRLTCWPHRGAGGGGAHAALGCSPPRTCGGLTTTPPQSNRLTCREPPCPAVSPGPTTPLNVQPDLGPSTSCLRSRPPAVALTGPPSAPRGLRTRPGSGAGRRGWPCLGDASVTQGAPRLGQKGRLLPLPQRMVRSKVTKHPVVTPSVEWGCWRDPPPRAVGRRHEKGCRKDLEDRWVLGWGRGSPAWAGACGEGLCSDSPS